MVDLFTADQLSQELKLLPLYDEQTGEMTPSPWGLAAAIRREVRRNTIVTRRELRSQLEPLLQSLGFGSRR